MGGMLEQSVSNSVWNTKKLTFDHFDQRNVGKMLIYFWGGQFDSQYDIPIRVVKVFFGTEQK